MSRHDYHLQKVEECRESLKLNVKWEKNRRVNPVIVLKKLGSILYWVSEEENGHLLREIEADHDMDQIQETSKN